MNRGRKYLRETIAIVLGDHDNRLPACLKNTLQVLWERYQSTVDQFKEIEKHKAALVKQLEPCKRLLDLEGAGNVCASMLYTSIGNGSDFKNGRLLDYELILMRSDRLSQLFGYLFHIAAFLAAIFACT